MRVRNALAAALIIAAAGFPAFAQHGSPATGLTIEKPWSRATPPTARTGAVFLTVNNRGTSADRLLSAASEAAESVELHTHLHEGSIMRMRKVDDIAIPAGKATVLAPGGLHVMLIGLRTPLKQGGQVELTLTFEQAGRIAVKAPILGVGALGPEGPRGHGGHGH